MSHEKQSVAQAKSAEIEYNEDGDGLISVNQYTIGEELGNTCLHFACEIVTSFGDYKLASSIPR
jgi:hypothetical protein